MQAFGQLRCDGPQVNANLSAMNVAFGCGSDRRRCAPRRWGWRSPSPSLPPDSDRMKVLMPTTWPSISTSGPPLLPGIDGRVGLDVDVGLLGSICRDGSADHAHADRILQSHADCRKRTQPVPASDRWSRPVAARASPVISIFSTARSVSWSMPTSLASMPRRIFVLGRRRFVESLQAHANLARALDHVRVGHDVAVGRENRTGANAALRLQVGGVVLLLVGSESEAGGEDLHHGLGDRARELLYRLAEDVQRIALQLLGCFSRVRRLLRLSGGSKQESRVSTATTHARAGRRFSIRVLSAGMDCCRLYTL